jgi:hypothetical protein
VRQPQEVTQREVSADTVPWYGTTYMHSMYLTQGKVVYQLYTITQVPGRVPTYTGTRVSCTLLFR